MHELSITQTLFDVVIEQAKRSEAKKVCRINLIIGEMTGIVGESVCYYLDFLSKNTIAEGASLNIKSIPVRARCLNCSKTFELGKFTWCCPDCDSAKLEITAGNELFIDSIEVD